MKYYFAKYLPVEGEIQIGDAFDLEGTIYRRLLDKKLVEGCKRVKFFLCSRNISIGDRIYGKISGYGVCTQNNIIESDFCVKYDSQEHEVEEDIAECIKVIGEISPQATWIKEGDEYDESEIDIVYQINDGLWATVTEQQYKDYLGKRLKRIIVKIKGSCGHYH